MTTAILDEKDQRRASVRAQAAAIADAPRPARRFSVPVGSALRASPRSRRNLRKQRRPVLRLRWRTPRRVIAVVVLLMQVTLLVLGLTLPAFKIRNVSVSGTQLVAPDVVLRTAGVPAQSIFTVDSNAIRSRLLTLPWVQDATVTAELPNRVVINVDERRPSLRVRRFDGDTFISDRGDAIPADSSMETLWSATPVLLDERAGSPQPLDLSLVRILGIIAQRFPVAFGVGLAAYQWAADGIFNLWTSAGSKIVLGHVDTEDALGRLTAELAALGSLRTQLDFAHPSFGYIDAENPSALAVAGSPGLPADVTAAKTPLPSQDSIMGEGGSAQTAQRGAARGLPHNRRPSAPAQPVTG